MVPFSHTSFFLVLVAFLLGVLIGRMMAKGRNQQKPGRFADLTPEEAKEISEKGQKTVAARIEKRKGRILAKVQEGGKITNDDVEDLFCISDTTARNYLSELEAEGKLVQVGESGRGVHYVPAKR
jgi:predicted HTH transcriptional regulator